jgi:hypothetical protein
VPSVPRPAAIASPTTTTPLRFASDIYNNQKQQQRISYLQLVLPEVVEVSCV